MSAIKKGDKVQVIAGKDKGKTGTVLSIHHKDARVIVEGINRVLRHTKESQTERGVKVGGIITKEAAIHLSNVQLVADDGKASRIGAKKDERGKNVRISVRTGKEI